MSVVGYSYLKHRCTKEINWESNGDLLIRAYKDLTRCNLVYGIKDVNSFLTKLQERSLLGIDRLGELKDLLKKMGKWDLLRMVQAFEIKRKDYKQFLEKIGRALDESNELQRLILICKSQNLIAHEREEHIADVNALFTALEEQNNLGIRNLSILRTMATRVEKPDLCKLVDDFEEKTKQEEDAEMRRKEWEDCKQRAQARAASFLSRRIKIGGGIIAGAALAISGELIGRELIGAVTPHCTFHNSLGVAVVVGTGVILRNSRDMEEFTNTFQRVVLPLGNFLRAIFDGSIRFTIQAEDIFALDALWQSYQDETLQTNLQEFLVTEEIEQLTGGEVRLTVDIDEDEYRNARLDLMISGIEEMKLEKERGLKQRASSDSDLLNERNMTTANTRDPFPEREFLPFDRKLCVEEYLEDLKETSSEFTLPSESGVGTLSSATSEYGFDKGDRLEKLDQVEGLIKDVIENWDTIREAYRDANPSKVRKYCSIRGHLEKIRMILGAVKEVEKEWMFAEPILTSSSNAEAVVQQLKNPLQNPSRWDPTAIRVLARKAKNLKRFDVLSHLKEITPRGTTGPQLPENMLIKEMPRDNAYTLSKLLRSQGIAEKLDLRLEMMRSREDTFVLDALTNLHYIRTVGELYDFLCERGLSHYTDNL